MEETDKTKCDNTDRQKLCGSARKRLKLYLKQGMNIEEARVLCQKPMKDVRSELNDLKIPKKRKHSEDFNQEKRISPNKVENVVTTTTSSDGSLEANNIGDELGTFTPKQQITNSDEIIRLAVIPLDFPNTIWSDEKLKLIQTAVLDKIIECKKGCLKPQFAGCSYKPGWLLFKCKGSNSELWVREHVPSLKPWPDAQLKVVPQDEVPKAEIFVGYFPEKPETLTSRILSLIEGQNEDLSVEFWKILNRISKNNIEEITFAIDPSSICKLKELGYHISYGYGTVHIRPTRRQYGVTNDLNKIDNIAPNVRRTRSFDMPRYSDEDISFADTRYSPRRHSPRRGSFDPTINSYVPQKVISYAAEKCNGEQVTANKPSASNNNAYAASNTTSSYPTASFYQEQSVCDKPAASSFNTYTTKNETTNFNERFRPEQNGFNKPSDERLFDTTSTNLPFTRRNTAPTTPPNYENEHDVEPMTFPNSYRPRENAEWSRRY